uniref:Pentatricopeptide repeat-containing protein At5g12100, mitochondrial-like n=1 Tax=Nicotiana sylvestris TaxID=4096 RepID=A0A1U7W637_NICSY|nr:PREDICTED: pentatricopeptide repeat-containing protein At5g12100, mitochondrial-like [Nicotiana sylvestris]
MARQFEIISKLSGSNGFCCWLFVVALLLQLLFVTTAAVDPLLTLLVLSIPESKLINEAKELYFMIREDKKFPSLSAFNVFLESLNSLRHYKLTLEVFDDVVSWGIRVDRFSYGKAIQSAVKLGDLGKALELLNCMRKDKLSLNEFVYNVVMGGLCKERRVGEARKLFDEMLERRVAPSKVTYNILMDGYCEKGKFEEAFKLRENMKSDNVEPNIVTFNTLLSGLCKLGKMEEPDCVVEGLWICT